ncbi:tight junction-associated protein 1 isoform X2 [Nelusetta ayraudi]|uniref:tight junction-associated protein 1 isoform X2 n=1 Tax=Nelusetta ayraudi TaxID=303726 RepID=UPI003F714F60
MASTARKPYRKAPPQHREQRHATPVAPPAPASHLDLSQEVVSDSDRIRMLQQQNEELQRRLALSSHKMEAMEAEFDGSRRYMEAELHRTRDDLDKMRDKFRRLQNSYTASQRANQDLEEKLHALLRKVERDKKTMDQEIVDLTNKLLDAKNSIDHLEELNERYRQDCNLAVQLLKCNKSHFRNHKFADLPYELQDMLHKHMQGVLPERGSAPSGSSSQSDPDTLSLTPADVVPTSVIARVLEKPEPLVLNSAQSSSCSRPAAEDVFVHVDMTSSSSQQGAQHNGSCRSQRGSLDGGEEAAAVAPPPEKLSPYPPPPPPNPLFPQGRKVIEFSSDDKVKIPKNSPLPNCTYATRQAISLSLVQSEHTASPTRGRCHPALQDAASEPPSSQSSPFSSPPQAPSVLASSGSSEEDLLANWQRMFVEKVAPGGEASALHRTAFGSHAAAELQQRGRGPGPVGGGASSSSAERGHQRAAYSDGEEGSSARSWTPSRGSSLDTDTDTEARGADSRGHCRAAAGLQGEQLLVNLDDDDDREEEEEEEEEEEDEVKAGPQQVEEGEEEGRDLPRDLPIISPRLLDPLEPGLHLQRPHRSPKRMGVHHLHRKDSLSRAQEQGTLLD